MVSGEVASILSGCPSTPRDHEWNYGHRSLASAELLDVLCFLLFPFKIGESTPEGPRNLVVAGWSHLHWAPGSTEQVTVLKSHTDISDTAASRFKCTEIIVSYRSVNIYTTMCNAGFFYLLSIEL